MKKLTPLFFLITAFSAVVFGQDIRIEVNTGHQGPVNSLSYLEDEDYIFSGGSDGTIRIWDRRSGNIVRRIQASDQTIVQMAINPRHNHVAILESDMLSSYTISVWDWEEEELLFTESLEESPLFFQYSSRGSFLYYCRAGWESLQFLHYRSGRSLDYMNRGFGIVSFATVASTERTIMTYSPSGTIYYWDIRTGAQRQRLRAAANLENIHLTSSNRFILASKENEIYLIDIVNGETKSVVSADGPILLISPENSRNRFAVLSTIESGLQSLSYYSYEGWEINEIEGEAVTPETRIEDMLFHSNTVYTANADGTIARSSRLSESFQVFSRNNLIDITDAAFIEDQMAAVTNDMVISFQSDFFSSRTDSIPSYMTAEILQNPLLQDSEAMFIEDEGLFLWNTDDSPGRYVILRETEDSQPEIRSIFSFPIETIQPAGDRNILSLESNGTCRIIDPSTANELFRHTRIGIQSIVYINESQLIAGKNRLNTFETSLMSININTRETVPIEDDSILVQQLLYDDKTETLYSVALSETSGEPVTLLRQHTGSQFQNTRTIFSLDEEAVNIPVLLDDSNANLYISLGFSGIRRWTGSRLIDFSSPDNIPESMFLHNRYLYVLNNDSSISVWNKFTGERVMDFYLFQDRNWVAIPAEGGFFSSDGGVEYLSLYRENSSVSNSTIENYRIHTEN
ncbi:MAG: WD40 repeat domain-containing protein [Spirochaetia bacterium]